MEYPFKDLQPLDEVLEREGYYRDWTHLDPEVFYSLTQISEYIKTKGYGVDVRLLIAQLAEHFGLKTTQVVDLANLLQQNFENLEGVTQSFTNNINSLVAQMEADKDAVIANATVDSEVILARGGKATLGQRLDETTAQLAGTRNLKSWELNSKDREDRGIVVFISDDARQADWDILRPIFNGENAPFCLATIANSIGVGSGLTLEQLLQLQSEGHEIISHSLDHDESDRIPDATDQEAERQYRDSKKLLNDLGLNVNSYSVPYGDYRQRERLLSKKHYRASRTSDYGSRSGLNLSPIATHELNTIWLDETWGKTNFEYFKGHIDLAVEKNALLIISTHAQQVSQPATQSVLRQVIQYAHQHSEIMTLNDALDIMGNVIEIGDYSYGIGNRQAKEGGHYVVGANGAVSNLVRAGKFNLSTPFADFPFGDNSYNLTFGELGGTSPSGGGGTLRNVKTHINPHAPLQAFNYQTFKGYGSKDVYIRHLQSSFEFTKWELFSAKPNYSVYTYTSSYTLEPNETKTLTVEPHVFLDNAPISVNPQYGPGDNVLFSHYVDGAGKLRIVLFNSGDTTINITEKKWNIMRVTL